MPNDLHGLHIVVTGCTGALGPAVTRELLSRGAICHLPVRAGRQAPEFPDCSGTAVVHPITTLEEDGAVAQLFARVSTQCGPDGVWGLAHTVGTFHAAPIAGTTAEHFRDQWVTNALSLFLCAREASKRMSNRPTGADRARAGGRIAAVLARPALEPSRGAGMTAYTAAKCAAGGFIAALGEELRPAGVLVNAVAPSIFDTPANRAAMPDADHSRWAGPEEIARAVAWLLSPENTLTTGAVVPVYGNE